jgi:hypothetical protein
MQLHAHPLRHLNAQAGSTQINAQFLTRCCNNYHAQYVASCIPSHSLFFLIWEHKSQMRQYSMSQVGAQMRVNVSMSPLFSEHKCVSMSPLFSEHKWVSTSLIVFGYTLASSLGTMPERGKDTRRHTAAYSILDKYDI